MKCEENVNYRNVGYDTYSDKCSFEAKYQVEWKAASGVFKRFLCKKHHKIKIDFIEQSKFEELVSSNEL